MHDRQYHLYSLDTGHFYSSREKYLHNMYCRYRRELPGLQEKIAPLSDMDAGYGQWTDQIRHKREKAKQARNKLLTLLSNKTAQNEKTDGADHIRTIREDSLKDTDIISMSDSALSRMIGIKPDHLTDALIIVRVYYFAVFKDLSFYGFLYKGEKYRYFTSSAGQIRTKKALFIKETVWNKIKEKVMCGLTIDKINAKGGNNVNRHLAYMALTNSTTDEWSDFDIDRSIVIDDFETNVYGTFDFVDETDYSITRKSGSVPIPHTDGAGMILPCISKKNFMFRAPWIKGLLGVFDFRKFVEVSGCSPVITDIYGASHDIIEEDIRIIFTKSQFKMYRYYESWDEYKHFFKIYGCHAGVCNVEEDRIRNAKINYQMLQTLTDITDEEIDRLTHRSAERIRNICNSKETMMETLGITPYNTNMTPFQQAVKQYPALLGDTYTKDILREIKKSLLKKYRSGKLEVNGKYTFLLPDYYAACEHWFQKIPEPDGLLRDKEVYCRLFPQHEKLDCLRSPHLYKEHAVRRNTANTSYGTRAGTIGEWFLTDGLYAGSHDLITKILMYDVDGDKALVVADKDFIAIAERNMNGIVPLYYNMRKAEPTELNKKNIYAGLTAAFTGANIGAYSNHIAKIWNSDVFLTGSEAEKQDATDCVKRLCCQNNFVIDYAKTLYKPEFPPAVKKQVSKYTTTKLPAFFVYAKDKTPSQVTAPNGSLVNRICDKIKDHPIRTHSICAGPLEYRKMMSDPQIVCDRTISDLYDRLARQYRYMSNTKEDSKDNLRYLADKIRETFREPGYSDETVADMLTQYLYGGKKRYKQLLWFCYGNNIVENLKKNTDQQKTKYIRCPECGEWSEVPTSSRRRRCETCGTLHRKKAICENAKRYYHTKKHFYTD